MVYDNTFLSKHNHVFVNARPFNFRKDISWIHGELECGRNSFSWMAILGFGEPICSHIQRITSFPKSFQNEGEQTSIKKKAIELY